MTTRDENLSIEKMFSPLGDEDSNQQNLEVASSSFRPILPVPFDEPEPNFEHPKFGEPEKVYVYRNSEGERLGYILRFPQGSGMPKGLPLTFCEGPRGIRGWRHKAFCVPRPLYGLHRLATAPNAKVLIVEGEKTAKAARTLFPELVVLTSPGGAMAAAKCDFAPLAGRHLIIWPDHDEAGQRYAFDVKQLTLETGAKSVAVVSIPNDFPRSWDLADPIPDGYSDFDIRDLAISLLGDDNKNEAAASELQSAIEELSRLSPLEYDQIRKSEASRLRVRVGNLDKAISDRRSRREPVAARPGLGGTALELVSPTPFTHSVDGAAVLDAVVETIKRFIVIDLHEVHALALWVMFAYCYDCFEHNPRLALLSPEKRCGKTTTLSLIGALVPRALQASNISPPSIFRVIEKSSPTLLIDEADTFIQKSDDLRGMLNAGHSKAAPYVIRVVGDDHEPRSFNVWAPVVIAKIGELHPTLQDRSVVIKMKRKRTGDKVDRLRVSRMPELEILKQKMARWSIDNLEELSFADPTLPNELNDRAMDNWRPLFSIAHAVGGTWPERSLQAALALSGVEASESSEISIRLLEDVRTIFRETGLPRIPTHELLVRLNKLEERPWPTLNNDTPMTPANLARLLKRYSIRAVTFRESTVRTLRGYVATDFHETFERYLEPESMQQ